MDGCLRGFFQTGTSTVKVRVRTLCDLEYEGWSQKTIGYPSTKTSCLLTFIALYTSTRPDWQEKA